jgi:hypothetical protein
VTAWLLALAARSAQLSLVWTRSLKLTLALPLFAAS